jgi:pimeloyl-ACP methyl ester carboxylesterase
LCIHGFTDTWRTWDLVLEALQRRHDVLAPTLAGHAGGPPLGSDASESALLDGLERQMDEAGFETADLVGNSLGGYLALHLAARGRAKSVVAMAPAGGWAEGDESYRDTMEYFVRMRELLLAAAPQADEIVSTDAGRRRATIEIATNYEHIPPELLAHQIRGAADCTGAPALIEHVLEHGWWLDAEAIRCPVRVVWGTADTILPWDSAAVRYREQWLPHADWVVLEGIGHCPQLDVPLTASELILGF